MNEEQLQLLRAARPSGQDERDASVVAARAAAAVDPVLLELLAQERERDLAMQAALENVAPPPGLAESLLTAMRAARGVAEPPPGLQQEILKAVQGDHRTSAAGTPMVPLSTRRSWLGWGMAAAASLTAGAFYWKRHVAFSMHRLSAELADISEGGIQLLLMSMDPDAINGWLSYYQAPRPGILPHKLAALPRKGCNLYQIDGHPVSLECFLLPGMRELHLFCTPAAGLLDPPAEASGVEIRPFGESTLATWTKGGQTVLLYSREDAASLGSLLA